RWPRDWSSDVCSSDLLVRGECQVPVRNNSGLAPRADREQMAWRELLDPGEDRVGCGNVLEAEVTGQAREVQPTRHGRMLEERSQDRKSTRLNSSHVAN